MTPTPPTTPKRRTAHELGSYVSGFAEMFHLTKAWWTSGSASASVRTSRKTETKKAIRAGCGRRDGAHQP